jgi:hypothetical protein
VVFNATSVAELSGDVKTGAASTTVSVVKLNAVDQGLNELPSVDLTRQ